MPCYAGEPTAPSHDAAVRPSDGAYWKNHETLRPAADPNIGADRVNSILNNPNVCRFYYRYGNHVENNTIYVDGHAVNNPRFRTVESPEELLSECKNILKDLGPGACSAIEMAGHAHKQSIGLADTLGIDIYGDRYSQIPSDKNIMIEIGACFREISYQKAPVIFTTCGGVEREGVMRFYPGKKEAQKAMSEYLMMPVISALGPCKGDGMGAFCNYGWLETKPYGGSEAKEIARNR